ncbi:cupin domain-containing protein [uncultured Albimonas sp.]|uniref:cupin domain-containing protein n=1 Tax=uncultured Albimonas sp. TaxID=1331701 RepID=UPI0030EE1DB9|tara:strand:- start:1276 stop:1650 length:375 start_codon:yes stop_codon:yes gene_type:complete
MTDSRYVVSLEDLEPYSPPLHEGTVNRRLLPADLGAGFEMAHGTLAPGGSASRHLHRSEWQVIYMLDGTAELEIGDEPRRPLAAGDMVRIPPGTPHLFDVTGDVPAKVLVIYSPPLGPDGFVPA